MHPVEVLLRNGMLEHQKAWLASKPPVPMKADPVTLIRRVLVKRGMLLESAEFKAKGLARVLANRRRVHFAEHRTAMTEDESIEFLARVIAAEESSCPRP